MLGAAIGGEGLGNASRKRQNSRGTRERKSTVASGALGFPRNKGDYHTSNAIRWTAAAAHSVSMSEIKRKRREIEVGSRSTWTAGRGFKDVSCKSTGGIPKRRARGDSKNSHKKWTAFAVRGSNAQGGKRKVYPLTSSTVLGRILNMCVGFVASQARREPGFDDRNYRGGKGRKGTTFVIRRRGAKRCVVVGVGGLSLLL